MHAKEYERLSRSIEEITGIAKSMGLDYFPMRYEVCPAEVLYSIGAYGMPARFAHWSFGKAYHRMKLEYDYGLSKIYELVINSNPCYAFLLDHNSLIQNKIIVAHVLGHSDFFKNNAMFSATDRSMLDRMSTFADRFHLFEHEFGEKVVEETLDAALAIQEHIDPHHRFGRMQGFAEADGLMKDVVSFIATNSRKLADWQREVLWMIREEMLYFWPQMETKIMNEGWASYWHTTLMHELDLDESDTIEFAKMNAAVLQPARGGINPYYVGIKMFEELERRHGRDAIFEIREMENDVSFLRNHLDQGMVEAMDLFLFQREGEYYKVSSKQAAQVRDLLIAQRTNGGFPYIGALDGDYRGRGELLLRHRFEGMELDRKYVQMTLPHLYKLWGKPVHLQTQVNGRILTYEFDGKEMKVA